MIILMMLFALLLAIFAKSKDIAVLYRGDNNFKVIEGRFCFC
jgi:hypothetical protein